MPNHVTSEIICAPEILNQVMSQNDKQEDVFEFGKIVPQPDGLMNESVPSDLIDCAKLVMGTYDLKGAMERAQGADIIARLSVSNLITMTSNPDRAARMDDERLEKLVAICKSIRETGFAYWYDWNLEHWGTKWGAYSARREADNKAQFDTAWSAPHLIITKLSTMFPESEITHYWADEDTGNNVGLRRYLNGELLTDEEYSNTKQGYELAFRLNGGEEYYRLNADGEYEYYDAEEE